MDDIKLLWLANWFTSEVNIGADWDADHRDETVTHVGRRQRACILLRYRWRLEEAPFDMSAWLARGKPIEVVREPKSVMPRQGYL